MNRIFSCITAISLVMIFVTQTAHPARAVEPSPSVPALQVIESNEQDLVLEMVVPEVQLELAFSDRGTCQTLRISGWGLSGEPGEPALPMKGTLVGLPTGATPKVTVFDAGPKVVQEGIDLCPTASLIQPTDPGDVFSDLGETLVLEPAAYAANRSYPGELAFVGVPGMIRSQSVVQVGLQPFQYNPVTRQLTTYHRLRVRVDFGMVPDPRGLSPAVDEGPFESVLRSQVINYAVARTWRGSSDFQVDAAPAFNIPSPAYKISVAQDGMLRINYADLQTAGVPVGSLDPRTFQLFNQSSEVALLVLGEADGAFNAEDSILFYGQKINTRFSDTNVYWLTWGHTDGLRMASSDGTSTTGSTPDTYTATVYREEDTTYLSNYPSGSDNDHWYWAKVDPPSTGLKTFIMPLTQVNTAGSARVRGFFKGYTASPQHHTHVSINTHLISEAFWPARSEFSFDVIIPGSYLLEGDNIIQVEAPLTDGISVNQVLVDWFEVEYTKNYAADGTQTRFSGDTAGTWRYRLGGFSTNDLITWDITDTLHPMLITQTVLESNATSFDLVFQQTITARRQYLAAAPANLPAPAAITPVLSANLRSSANKADYIIITHPDFASAIQPLAAFYTARGLRVKTINVIDIYNEFSGGVLDPAAIHDFLATTYTSWARPAPSYVLLVGDGNYDFKNFYLANDTVFIPPYLADVDPWLGETAADNRYVAISGTDILPDMALGRLPMQTAAETSAIVAKILDHYQNFSGDWAKQALFVAGNNDPAAGNFAALSDAVVNTYLTPQSVMVDKVYYMTPPYTSGLASRQAVASAINSGRGLVHFTGHSNPYAWFGDTNIPNAFETKMLDTPNIPLLANAGKYPFVISMTCFTGYYILPGATILDETLVRTEAKGAMATWSPTGEGVASGHDLLDSGFFQAIYQDHVTTLGFATNQAKYYLYANSGGLHHELIDTYILFGDPAMLYQSSPTSVNLNYFHSQVVPSGIQLTWETTNDATTLGFNLYRRERLGNFVKLNSDLIPANPGYRPQAGPYTYLDTSALLGTTYEYRLDMIENSLQVSMSNSGNRLAVFGRTTSPGAIDSQGEE